MKWTLTEVVTLGKAFTEDAPEDGKDQLRLEDPNEPSLQQRGEQRHRQEGSISMSERQRQSSRQEDQCAWSRVIGREEEPGVDAETHRVHLGQDLVGHYRCRCAVCTLYLENGNIQGDFQYGRDWMHNFCEFH